LTFEVEGTGEGEGGAAGQGGAEGVVDLGEDAGEDDEGFFELVGGGGWSRCGDIGGWGWGGGVRRSSSWGFGGPWVGMIWVFSLAGFWYRFNLNGAGP